MNKWKLVLSWCFSFLVIVFLAWFIVAGTQNAKSISDKEGLKAAERAVRQGVVCYYALEGTYPATYEEMREYCQLAIDDTRYIVFYEVFASNIMPDITVLERAGNTER